MGIVGTVKQIVRRAIGLPAKNTVILMYHRVVDVDSTPYHSIVSTEHFAQHMAYLQQRCRCLALPELADAVRGKAIPRKSVVITFDDGYSDNYHTAFPILKKFQLPATIFITSQYVGSRKEFWWDELERLFILPKKLPECVPFTLGNRTVDLNFARFDQDQRMLLLRGMHGFLKSCRPADRETILSAVRDLSGIDENGREAYLPMTAEQIAELARSGLMDIGAHTMTHPSLSSLSREEQQLEILGSIQAVAKITGKPVRTFAYPFGSAQDINSASIDIIRSSGIQAAVTTTTGVVRHNSDLAALPRVWVGNWDLDTFRKKIEPYF